MKMTQGNNYLHVIIRTDSTDSFVDKNKIVIIVIIKVNSHLNNKQYFGESKLTNLVKYTCITHRYSHMELTQNTSCEKNVMLQKIYCR